MSMTRPSPAGTASRRGAEMEKTRQWSLLTAVAVVVVLAAGWFLLVSKQNHKAAELKTQASQVQSENSGLASQVAQLKAQSKDLPAQQARLNKIAQQVPDNPALPSLIRQLTTAANAAGVDLVSLAPATPSLVQAAPAAAAASTSTSTSTSSASAPAQ